MKETAAKGCWDAFRFFFVGGWVAEKSLKMLYLKIWVKYDVMHVKRGREREREREREGEGERERERERERVVFVFVS